MLKNLCFLCLFLLCTEQQLTAQTEFELDPLQSMLMTGKGPGQDGTINPYEGEDCMAIIENIGEKEFYIRVQKRGEIISTAIVPVKEVLKIKLLKDQELYLDPNNIGIAKARVSYEEIIKD